MLEHQEANSESSQPAAQVRVKSEELARALASIEARRQEEARQLEGTVVIGDVVQELQLDATPEEVWAEIQKQRAQARPHAGAVRTVRLEAERPATSWAEHGEDAPIKTLHRSTGTDTKALVGVIIAALLLCLLGFAISLTSTPKSPVVPRNPRPAAPTHTQAASGAVTSRQSDGHAWEERSPS